MLLKSINVIFPRQLYVELAGTTGIPVNMGIVMSIFRRVFCRISLSAGKKSETQLDSDSKVKVNFEKLIATESFTSCSFRPHLKSLIDVLASSCTPKLKC